MPRLVPLVVALLAITAGCTGAPIAPGEEPTRSPTDAPSTTTQPPPDDSVADLDGPIAPGVTADGIENATALLEAHADALLDRGFVLEFDRSVERDGETVVLEQRFVAAPGLDVFRADESNTLSGDRTIQRTWVDESMERQLVRVDVDGETKYRSPPIGPAGSERRAFHARQRVGAGLLADVLEGGSFEVIDVEERDGEPRYRLVGTDFSTDGNYGERDVTLIVDGAGVIHRLEANGSLAGGDFTFDYRVERLGVEDVDRPGWVAEAPAPIDTRPVAGFENCSSPFLTLSNEDPDAVPEGSIVTVTLDDAEHEATLDAPLETGERVALYLDGGGGDLRVDDVDSVPANRTAMPNEAQVVVETGDGLLLSSGSMGFGCESAGEGNSGGGSGGE